MKFAVVFFAALVISLTMAFPQWPVPNLKKLADKAQAIVKEDPSSDASSAEDVEDGQMSALDDVIGGAGFKPDLGKYIPTDISEVVGTQSGWSSFLQLIFGLLMKMFMPSVPGVDAVPGASTAVAALGGITG